MLKWAEKFSNGVGGGSELPAAGEKFGQLVHGMGGDAGEHVAQIIKRIDRVALAGGDEAEEDRGRRAAVVAAAEEPVFPVMESFPQSELSTAQDYAIFSKILHL